MELTDEAKEDLVNQLTQEFWFDTQDVISDVVKDIINKIFGFSENTKITFIIQIMSSIFALETARFTCMLDEETRDDIWEQMKELADSRYDDFAKVFKGIYKASDCHETKNSD